MMAVVATPSVEGLQALLREVQSLETEFATLVSGILNEQGFDTEPSYFTMASTALHGAEQEPIRQALTALLQQPSS